MEDILTKGDVIVNKLNVGDIIYEFEYNIGIESKVITKPEPNEEGIWTWKAENVRTGKIINYAVNPKYSHYGPNLYTYKAYIVKTWL